MIKSEDIIYAMAILLGFCLFFYVNTAEAVTKKQVKRIVKQTVIQEIRKQDLRGPPGPQGIQGPPGPAGYTSEGPGPQFLYAKVLPNGEVDESRSMGVTSADVQLFGAPEVRGAVTRVDFNPITQSYCFKIPANGAQVTLDAEEVSQGAVAGIFFARKEGCEFFVRIVNRDLVRTASGFFITIY